MDQLIDFVSQFPQGISAGEIESQLKLGRSTLNRRLRAALASGDLIAVGNGPARRYQPADALVALKSISGLVPICHRLGQKQPICRNA